MLSLLELSMEVESGLKTKKELPSKLLPKTAKFRELKGTWIDIHDKPMSFNARRFHKIEPHEGQMWALAAYTPQSFERCSDEVRSKLEVASCTKDRRRGFGSAENPAWVRHPFSVRFHVQTRGYKGLGAV